jgi:soluble lytic murein transglycosylase-like protein
MSSAIAASSSVRQALALALLAAFSLVQPARAEISIRDDGAGGIVFTNLPGAAGPTAVPAKRLEPAASARMRAVPRQMRRREQLRPLVAAAADTHGLPEALLQAVIEVESDFNPDAVSPRGAVGLMQLMPQTARHLGVADARDPAANIDGGARYLKELLARFKNDLSLALAAYNAGPGAVQRSGAIPVYAETQSYVPRVILRYHSLQSGLPVAR